MNNDITGHSWNISTSKLIHHTTSVDGINIKSQKQKLSGMGFEPMPTLVDQILSLTP